MPVGDRQKLITSLVSKVFDIEPDTYTKFSWLINQHTSSNFKDSYGLIDEIFKDLNGVAINKRITLLQPDAYYGGRYNLFFEFDELQHFTTSRLKSLMRYPNDLPLNFSIEDWIRYCKLNAQRADKYRFNKTTVDFNFQGGRTSQRAYLDCFRDLLPQYYNLNPTLRLNEFEVMDVDGFNTKSLGIIENLLNKKLKYL